MASKNQTEFIKDLPGKKITVTREFNASPEDVWRAYTESDLLDQWWAPKPWKSETKTMDFREGGHWLYAMVGPENKKHWARVDYHAVNPMKSFSATDMFTDENGNRNYELPGMEWKNDFHATASGTKVITEITFASEEDMRKIMEMGFEEGFTAALGNLDEYFEKN